MEKTAGVTMLRSKKLFIFDLDGTIYLDGVLFPGALELLERIRKNSGEYVFFTNNSSISTIDYLHKIQRLGIPCEIDNVATSTQALIIHIRESYPDARFYVMGTASMKAELRESGLLVVDRYQDDIDGVVIGYDTELVYQKLIDVSRLLTQGKIYLATNPDLVCPVEFGFVPDCGSFAVMLENATKRRPRFLGKPEPDIIEMIINRFGVLKEETVLVGDRLYTDIKCGINAGIDTVLVLSGETTVQDLELSDFQPTFVVSGVHSILEMLED
ncbi:MAG: HAD-IIA family hydrolase [Candidatus Izemoplasmatales bacterium]|jgi:HAD superfamily hydrolase (TIGR01457 family)